LSLEGILEELGVLVDKAYDGEDAYQKVVDAQNRTCEQHGSYKLVILDNEMPIKSGYEVATMIRNSQ